MRTSLMLNGGTLDGAHLEVTSAQSAAPATGALPGGATGKTAIGAGGVGSGPVGHGLEQEDKPVAGIVAECECCVRAPDWLWADTLARQTSRTATCSATTSSSAPSRWTVSSLTAPGYRFSTDLTLTLASLVQTSKASPPSSSTTSPRSTTLSGTASSAQTRPSRARSTRTSRPPCKRPRRSTRAAGSAPRRRITMPRR